MAMELTRIKSLFTAYKKEIDLGEIVLSGSIPMLSGSRFSPAKQPAKIDGRQPGASNPPRRSRHRESPMRILLILGGLRNGYGIDPDKTISPRSISFFIGGKLSNSCLFAKSKLERLFRTLGEIRQRAELF